MNQSVALPNPAVEGVSVSLLFYPELYDAYFYHSDHLGSSNYISNNTGIVSQHTEYLPFGETFVDEHLNSHNTPFKFNAKELDDETGNYYYGARYYNPKWNVWLSVDPLVEMFPDRPPYEYCFSNPLRYIDPTGMGPEPPTEKGEYEGQECYDEDTGATYLADNNGNWHSDLGGVHNLNEVVVGAEKSTGNTFFTTDGKSRKRHPLEYMKSDTPWMDKAKSQLGVKEDFVNGSYNNTGSDVEKYMKSSGLPKGNPWCGAFVFWSLDESGINVTGVKGNPNWALNWRGFGNSIASPAYGAIATKRELKVDMLVLSQERLHRVM
jgi:RHS repeat-associated protein